jgi:hypothetical protein
MTTTYRVRLKHRPHYTGFLACTYHAREMENLGIAEITLVDPHEVLVPRNAPPEVSLCHACNRDKGVMPVPAARVALG